MAKQRCCFAAPQSGAAERFAAFRHHVIIIIKYYQILAASVKMVGMYLENLRGKFEFFAKLPPGRAPPGKMKKQNQRPLPSEVLAFYDKICYF